jgi:3-oxoisoapionate decarboxylase
MQANKHFNDLKMNYPDVKFGISSWTYPWSVGVANGPQPPSKLTVMDLLQKAKTLDVKLLQIADNIPLEKLSREELAELRSVAQEMNISLEVGTKGIEVDHLLNFLEIAVFLNSPIIRTLPGSILNKPELSEVGSNLRKVLPAFEKAGVVLVLENYEAFSAQEYLELMQSINHSNLRMCIDLANALGKMEGPYYFMEKLAPWCGNFHFKDVVVNRSTSFLGFSVIGKPVGQGDIPIKWVMAQLMKYNLYPTLIIEFWPPFQKTIEETMKMENEWALQSVEFMRTLRWE